MQPAVSAASSRRRHVVQARRGSRHRGRTVPLQQHSFFHQSIHRRRPRFRIAWVRAVREADVGVAAAAASAGSQSQPARPHGGGRSRRLKAGGGRGVRHGGARSNVLIVAEHPDDRLGRRRVAGAEPSHPQRERDETKHCSFRRLGNAAGLASRVPAPGRAPGSARQRGEDPESRVFRSDRMFATLQGGQFYQMNFSAA
jgi:hypothetical protein